MRQLYECNARRRLSWSMLLAVLPSATVPLLVVAWATRPAVTAVYLERGIPALDRRVQLTESLRARSLELGLELQTASYEAWSDELRALVPEDASAFDIFRAMRSAALQTDFELISVQLGVERELEWGWPGHVVRGTEVHLIGRGTPSAFIELLDAARAGGRPLGVRSLDMSRRIDSASRFDVIATLETYWSAETKLDTSVPMEPAV